MYLGWGHERIDKKEREKKEKKVRITNNGWVA